METNHSGTSQFLPLSMTFGYLNDANTPTASDTDLQHDYELLYRRMMAVEPTLASLFVQTLSTHDVLRVVREIMVTHPGGYKHRDFLVVFRVMFDFMALVQVMDWHPGNTGSDLENATINQILDDYDTFVINIRRIVVRSMPVSSVAFEARIGQLEEVFRKTTNALGAQSKGLAADMYSLKAALNKLEIMVDKESEAENKTATELSEAKDMLDKLETRIDAKLDAIIHVSATNKTWSIINTTQSLSSFWESVKKSVFGPINVGGTQIGQEHDTTRTGATNDRLEPVSSCAFPGEFSSDLESTAADAADTDEDDDAGETATTDEEGAGKTDRGWQFQKVRFEDE